jgi:hypothetical protein
MILRDYRTLLMTPRVAVLPDGDAVVLPVDCGEVATVTGWINE